MPRRSMAPTLPNSSAAVISRSMLVGVSRGATATVASKTSGARTGSESEMDGVQIWPVARQVLAHEPPVTVLGRCFAAEQRRRRLEVSRRQHSLDLPLGHERREPLLEQCPAALFLLVRVEEGRGRRELRL